MSSVTFKDIVPIITTGFGIIGSIFGVYLGQRIGKKNAVEVSEKQFAHSRELAEKSAIETRERGDLAHFRQAAGKFRAVFAIGIANYNLSNIKSKGHDWNCKWQDNYFPGQAAAIEEFRPFIKPERLSDYQKAWEEYHHPHGLNDPRRFDDYFIGEETKCREEFLRRISAILEFAKNP
jgi:hypothetical protein